MDKKKQCVAGKSTPVAVGGWKQNPDEMKNLTAVMKDLMGSKKLSKYHASFQRVCYIIDRAGRLEKQVVHLRNLVAPKDSAGDSAALEDKLKAELERAWSALDEAYDREEQAAQIIAQLELKIADMEAERGSSASVSSRQGRVDELERANEQIKKKMKSLEEELKNRKGLEKKWEKEKGELTKKLSKATKASDSLKEKLIQESKKREELEREVQKLVSSSRAPKSTDSISSPRGSTSRFQRHLMGSRSKLLDETDRELEKHKQRAIELEQESSRKDGTIQDLTEKVRVREESLERSRESEEALRKEIASLKDQLLTAQGKLKNEVSRQRDCEALKRKNEALQREIKILESEIEDKREVISELVNLKDHFSAKDKKAQERILKLTNELASKESEKRDFELAVAKLNDEIQKYKNLVEQMEKNRDLYTAEVESLESKVCDLEGKLSELDPENRRRVPGTDSTAGSCGAEVPAPEESEDVKAVAMRVADEEIRRLNEDVVEKERDIKKMQSVMDQQRRLLEQISKYASGDSVGDGKQLPDDFGSAERESLEKSRTTALSSAAQMVLWRPPKELELLREKVLILEEVIRRGRKKQSRLRRATNEGDFSESSSFSDHQLLRISDATDEIAADGSDEASADTTEESSEGREDLSRKVQELESLLETKTRAIAEKDECLKSQFEIIDELKKCVSASSQDDELRAMGHRLERQQKMVKQLREKVEVYESHIKDYQDEIRSLTERLRASGPTSVPAGKISRKESWTMGPSLADSAKKQKGRWQMRI